MLLSWIRPLGGGGSAWLADLVKDLSAVTARVLGLGRGLVGGGTRPSPAGASVSLSGAGGLGRGGGGRDGGARGGGTHLPMRGAGDGGEGVPRYSPSSGVASGGGGGEEGCRQRRRERRGLVGGDGGGGGDLPPCGTG
jgi:hypothetical protein